MARYSGGPVTHRALTGARFHATDPDARKKHEVLYTLQCVHEIRAKLNRNEYSTVKIARDLGLSWTEIATSLGVSRQAAWERWHEVDGEVPPALPTPNEPTA
jgi:hypothetical protein